MVGHRYQATMKTLAAVAAVAAAAVVAAATKTLPMVVPSTAEELLAMPAIVLERLQQQERARAAHTAREIVGGVEVDPPFKYPWYGLCRAARPYNGDWG